MGSKQPRLLCVHHVTSGVYSYHTEKIMLMFHFKSLFQYLTLKSIESYVFISYRNRIYFSGLFIFIDCINMTWKWFLKTILCSRLDISTRQALAAINIIISDYTLKVHVILLITSC